MSRIRVLITDESTVLVDAVVPRTDPSLDALLSRLARRAEAPRGSALSRRELEVLRQMARGLSNQRIATLFNISLTTVRTHISNILHKLDANNRVEATIYALRDGLTTLEDCLEPGRAA